MNPLRSVGARLSLALVLLLAAALGTVYLVVVPSLRRNLENAKFSQLRRTATLISEEVTPNLGSLNLDEYVQNAAANADARVLIYYAVRADLEPVADNAGLYPPADRVAYAASRGGELTQGIVTHGHKQYAEVAIPIAFAYYLQLQAPLSDALGNVHLVRRRLLEAGLLALLASLVVGYGAASFFARRLRRLEQAAERIAAGDFEQPVVDPSNDEVGQLARAFERMRQRLAQLDHARREFIANASHELRTPLFSLGGFLELLDDDELDHATRREFVETMREQVERLTKLATELLDLSRLDAGRLRIDLDRVELADVAEALVDEFRAVARARDHRLELAVEAEPFASGDTERVVQIGRNLIENALVHTPAGTRVVVRVGERAGRAELAVEDDGLGIADEHAPHVFDRFYRIEGDVASGSGLGLAIARELAALMGGSVELVSPRSPTSFALLLPLAGPAAELFPVETAASAS